MDIVYNSRDGSERTISTAAAKVLSDLTRYVLGSQEIFQVFVESYGLEQFTGMISEVFRLSGSGFILKVPAGTDSTQEQMGSIVRQLQGAMEQQETTDEDLQNQIKQIGDQLSAIAEQLNVSVTNTAVASTPEGGASDAQGIDEAALPQDVSEQEIVAPPDLQTADT